MNAIDINWAVVIVKLGIHMKHYLRTKQTKHIILIIHFMLCAKHTQKWTILILNKNNYFINFQIRDTIKIWSVLYKATLSNKATKQFILLSVKHVYINTVHIQDIGDST